METDNKYKMHRYVGELGQVCGIKAYTYTDGKASGVKALDIKNGAGLHFTVLQDRCLDISSLTFNGLNCSYMSKTGITAPAFSGNGTDFHRSFFAGFLTTCGLRNVGNACEEQGETFCMHGRISNVPAEEVCVSTNWVDGKPEMTVCGKMREAAFFGENLVLTREITCRYGENRIRIRNTVENLGFKPELLMLLLHFNIGYPLLDENTRLLTPSENIVPRDANAAVGIEAYDRMQAPTPGYAEQVFYHELSGDTLGNTMVALIHPLLEIGLSMRFNKKQFTNFVQWKQMGEGEYVLGMEPCNCYVGGRFDPRNKEVLSYLQPFEKKEFDVTIDLYSGKEQLQWLEKNIQQLKT